MLGEFEYLVLAIAERLGGDAYGASILTELETATGRRVSIGALYTTLDRLTHKGFVATTTGDPTPARRGRPRRMVRVTAAGTREARIFYNTILRASEGARWALE